MLNTRADRSKINKNLKGQHPCPDWAEHFDIPYVWIAETAQNIQNELECEEYKEK